MLSVVDRLRSLIPHRQEAAFAARAGVPQSTLRGTLKHGNPQLETLVAIARAGGVTVEWLATGEGPMRPEAPSPTPGAWLPAAQTQYLGVNEDRAKAAFYAVSAGDSGIKAAVAIAVTALGDHSQTIRPERLADLIDATHQALQAGFDPALVTRIIASAAQP